MHLADEGHAPHRPKGKRFALAVMKFLNDKCLTWRGMTNISFSYGTPMESTTYKFASASESVGWKIYVTDKNYITNSYHVHVTEPTRRLLQARL